MICICCKHLWLFAHKINSVDSLAPHPAGPGSHIYMALYKPGSDSSSVFGTNAAHGSPSCQQISRAPCCQVAHLQSPKWPLSPSCSYIPASFKSFHMCLRYAHCVARMQHHVRVSQGGQMSHKLLLCTCKDAPSTHIVFVLLVSWWLYHLSLYPQLPITVDVWTSWYYLQNESGKRSWNET